MAVLDQNFSFPGTGRHCIHIMIGDDGKVIVEGAPHVRVLCRASQMDHVIGSSAPESALGVDVRCDLQSVAVEMTRYDAPWVPTVQNPKMWAEFYTESGPRGEVSVTCPAASFVVPIASTKAAAA